MMLDYWGESQFVLLYCSIYFLRKGITLLETRVRKDDGHIMISWDRANRLLQGLAVTQHGGGTEARLKNYLDLLYYMKSIWMMHLLWRMLGSWGVVVLLENQFNFVGSNVM
ncbi:hypothetical protein L6164_023942 [Bauhinia variegata]|uniref:Uncharacterized protein n=1 Tax=Bauhinia variegata TaxID=167791 RepID=A0ACB9LVX5_BAUVA|nr:hypothetical protein L6164_023942 [Bauhinia variegata]